jgi:hypothetical protein
VIRTRDDLEVSLALVALGIADRDERWRVAAAAARDPRVARRLRDLCDTAARLAQALPVTRPPPLDG